MKRITFTIILFLCLLMAGTSEAQAKKSSKSFLQSLAAEYEGVEGVEVLDLGSFSTSMIKMLAKLEGESPDEDDMESLALMDGVKGMLILDYEDAAPQIRDEISGKLTRHFENVEPIMEARDDGDIVFIFGTIDNRNENVKDLIIFTPSDCALICLFGSIPMNAVADIAD